MRKKQFVAAILLGVVLCFVSGLGYAKVKESLLEPVVARRLEFRLLDAQVAYIMTFPDTFLRVLYFYDGYGDFAKWFPAGVLTKDKIIVEVIDNRDYFHGAATEKVLLSEFEFHLSKVTFLIQFMVDDLANDIVARFTDIDGNHLGYFYQGEYHLWEE